MMTQSQKRVVLLVVGTRPEAIKMAPVYASLEASGDLEPRLCVTGQHRDLLDSALAEFGLRAAIDLDLMEDGQTPDALLHRAVPALCEVLSEQRPNLVLAQGDTTTTLAAALAAFYSRVPFGHVEAGLRTHRLDAPYPEEMNRVLTAQLAALHFAPTPLARNHLLNEGIEADAVIVTGNTVIDALRVIRAQPEGLRQLERILPAPVRRSLASGDGRVILVTAHRRENHGTGLHRVCDALLAMLAQRRDLQFVVSVHPNPLVSSVFRERLATSERVHLLSPPPYGPFIALMSRVALLLTDSGGIQEEAAALGTPVVVMRDHTERPELIEAGLGRLTGADPDAIAAATAHFLAADAAVPSSVFGDGRAAERIVEAVGRFLSGPNRYTE